MSAFTQAAQKTSLALSFCLNCGYRVYEVPNIAPATRWHHDHGGRWTYCYSYLHTPGDPVATPDMETFFVYMPDAYHAHYGRSIANKNIDDSETVF